MSEGIAIIGCGAAGATAAMQARKFNRDIKITLFNKESYSQYSRCGLPYTISRKVAQFEDLILMPPENWATININAKLTTLVTEIDHNAHRITFENPEGKDTLDYSALIFATGAFNVNPPIKGLEKKRIYGLRTIDDVKLLDIEAEKAKEIVVIGGGLVGMETAEAFIERGAKVTVVEFLSHLLPTMVDPDFGQIIEEHCKEHGMQVLTNTAAMEIIGNESPKGVVVKSRSSEETTTIPADAVLVATGVRSDTKLAENIGVKIGPMRGIETNERMETNLKDVYACGDCAENYEFITGKPMPGGLGTIAVRQARVAGINAAGGDERFPGIVGAKVTKLFDLEIASTGMTEDLAKKYDIPMVKGSIKGSTKPPYFQGGKDIKVKTYFHRDTGKLVGAQILGLEDAAMRINVITLGIQRNVDAVDLFDFENCYAPAICDTWDPLVESASVARRRLKM